MPQFVEQPRVLYGYNGLGSEALYQRDLLVGERSDFLARQEEGADHFALSEQWNAKERPYAAKRNCRRRHRITLGDIDLLRRNIVDMSDGSGQPPYDQWENWDKGDTVSA